MAVWQRTFDDDGVLAGWQRGAAFEECAEPFDEVGRPVSEVEQGALLDLAVDPIALARRDVQVATGAEKPPGAWVHVLTIGINDYDDKAKDLHLDFASKDASDVFNALVNTQDSRFNKLGGLHAEVLARALPDELATASTQAKTNSSIGTFLT
jgi:hypothetical protein